MKKLITLATLTAVAFSISAKEAANDSLVENYMRSSLYTIILKSDKQNKHFEEETKKAADSDALMSTIKSFANTDAKKAANETEAGSIFELPAAVFPSIEIPNQFNDHNLAVRVIDFDAIKSTISADEAEKYRVGKKKGGGFGKFAKAAAGMNTAGDDINADFDNYVGAVMHKFFAQEKVPANLLAKWYNYDANRADNRWNLDVVTDRGAYNFSKEDLARAADDAAVQRKIDQTAFDMIGNTYVMAVNLRFRSNQAIVAEASAAADAVAGAFGFGGLGKLAGSAANAAAGEGFVVQAVSNLYRLKWNDDINQNFAVNIFEKNATLDDLIASGMCELEFVGSEKARSHVRQSMLSDKPMSDLVKRATARAIDEAICKLQSNHEEFRTVMPIIGGNEKDGVVYARIGTKEGLGEKDEYEILEKQEDKDGKTVYKSIGNVKPVKGKIWNNAYGAEEELAEDGSKAKDADREAVNRGYSEFKGKKGDFRGYYLRLKKKK